MIKDIGSFLSLMLSSFAIFCLVMSFFHLHLYSLEEERVIDCFDERGNVIKDLECYGKDTRLIGTAAVYMVMFLFLLFLSEVSIIATGGLIKHAKT